MMRKIQSLVMVVLLFVVTIPQAGCTPEAWRQFQQTMGTVNRYVSDGMAALSIVLSIVDNIAPSDTVRDIRAAVSVAQTILREEADFVEQQNSPLNSPSQVAAAFPRFIEAWNRVKAAVDASGFLRAAPAVGSRENGYTEPVLVDPLVVRRAR